MLLHYVALGRRISSLHGDVLMALNNILHIQEVIINTPEKRKKTDGDVVLHFRGNMVSKEFSEDLVNTVSKANGHCLSLAQHKRSDGGVEQVPGCSVESR